MLKKNIINYIMLQVGFLIYSLSSFFLKYATYNNENIKKILIFYCVSVVCLGIYALLWQQILKRMSLSVAFSNKGTTIIWGVILGAIFFNEPISFFKMLGAIIVIIGIVIIMGEKEEVSK